MQNFWKTKEHKTALSAISYGAASVITQLLSIIYSIVLANWLGAEQYGYIAAVFAATSISSFLFNWGFNQYLMKSGSSHSKPETLGGAIIFIKSVLGFVWGLLIFFILRLIRPEIYLGHILILTILEVWFDSQFGTLIAIIILKNRVRVASVLLVLSRFSRLLLLIGFITFGKKSLFLALFLRLATTIISLIIAWVAAKPKLNNINKSSIQYLFKHSIAFNTGELLDLIYINADVNILVWLGALPTLIASYSIVISLVNATLTLPNGMFYVLLPSLVHSYKEKLSLFKRRFRMVYTLFIILAFSFWISITYLSKPLITSFLGDSYVDSIQMLICLAPVLGLRTINQANIAYLISVNWQSRRLFPQLLTLIFKITFGMIFISKYSTKGMILITIFAELLLVALYVIQIIRHKSRRAKAKDDENFDDIL